MTNLLGLCVAHYLVAVHRGRLAVTGRAGERPEWHFGTSEEWTTFGDDDVRKGDA